jgi:chromate transporter
VNAPVVDSRQRTDTPGIPFRKAVLFWLKLGFISFGGPAGQIAIMHKELVEDRRWISERRFLHALNYCMVLPGPEAQQLATYIGWLMHRTWGGIIAGLLFVLPSLLMLIALTWVYLAWGDLPLIAGLFYGIKPAVTAIVVHAAYRIGSRALKHPALWAIAAAAFVAIFALHIPFPWIILGAAGLGFMGGKLAPTIFQGSRHSAATARYGPSIIDDNTPPAAHTRFRWQRCIALLVIGALLWALPMSALVFVLGWEHTFTQMAWFFTKAALLTFGGAYAVLPYVYQGAVMHYGWLNGQQMIDGLALGETTPGPLIMVVAFVGFAGGWLGELFGPEQAFLAGAMAAMLVTYFTFLPSFLLILIGGPLVESTHNALGFTAPLTAITAAVVGVILNLALFFAYHTLWPQGLDAHVEWPAAVIVAAAALALFRFKRGVIEVIATSAVAGLLLQFGGWLSAG